MEQKHVEEIFSTSYLNRIRRTGLAKITAREKEWAKEFKNILEKTTVPSKKTQLMIDGRKINASRPSQKSFQKIQNWFKLHKIKIDITDSESSGYYIDVYY